MLHFVVTRLDNLQDSKHTDSTPHFPPFPSNAPKTTPSQQTYDPFQSVTGTLIDRRRKTHIPFTQYGQVTLTAGAGEGVTEPGSLSALRRSRDVASAGSSRLRLGDL